MIVFTFGLVLSMDSSDTPDDSTTAAVLVCPEAGLKGEGPEAVPPALSHGLGGAADPPYIHICFITSINQ